MQLTDEELASIFPMAEQYIFGVPKMWEDMYENWYKQSPHKIFEHYASVILAAPIHVTNTLLDVAADESPFIHMVEEFGLCWNNFRQDLSYTPDIWGDMIGSSASYIPLPDNSVDIMTLHCSYEHFEGDEDKHFLKECGRLLKNGGKCIILPFYTWHEYLETPPQPSPNTGFGRFYDIQAIQDRILTNLGSLTPVVYNVYLGKELKFRALVLTNEMHAS